MTQVSWIESVTFQMTSCMIELSSDKLADIWRTLAVFLSGPFMTVHSIHRKGRTGGGSWKTSFPETSIFFYRIICPNCNSFLCVSMVYENRSVIPLTPIPVHFLFLSSSFLFISDVSAIQYIASVTDHYSFKYVN